MDLINKEKFLNSVADLPEAFSFEELLDRIILIQNIEKGLEQSSKGETVSTEEARKILQNVYPK